MAIVVIVLHDKPEGGVDVRLDCEPAPHPLAKAQTPAQSLASVVLQAVSAHLAEDKPRLQLIMPH